MENKVGDKLLTPQKQAQLLKALKDIVEQLRPYGVTLTPDDRRRVLRPRKGAEQHMARVYQLAKKHGVTIKNVDLEGMNADLALAKQFQPFEDEFRAGLHLGEDTGAQADSESWEAFLAYYGVLSSMAERSPELAADLAGVTDFMALGPRKRPPPTAAAK
jgi:hypothetical protein